MSPNQDVKTVWPPRAFFQTPARLFEGQEPQYLTHFRPTPPPFYIFAGAHFPPGQGSCVHSHPCVSLHGCLQGPVTLRAAGHPYALDTGTFYLLPPGMGHQWRNDGPHTAVTTIFLIDADHPGPWPAACGLTECCQELKRLVANPHRFQTAGDPELYRAFWQLADHLLSDAPAPPLVTTGLLCTLLGRLIARLRPPAEASATETDVIRQLRRLLLARVEGRLDLRALADEVVLSPSRVKQLFHQTFGCGVMTYFKQLKIWRAKQLLCDPTLTVEQVSYQLGFSSPSHFSRVFHRHTGESPTTFRLRRAEL
jgi:AraC-like DNA-binding protein/quercetin dioxygenase-like cupin family protein